MEVDSPQSQGGGDATRGRLKGLAQKARVFSAFESALATLSPSAQRRQGASRVLESAGKRASLADEPEPPEPIGTPELQPEDARSGEKVLELARKAARKEIENRRASRRVPSVGAQVSEALTPGSPAGAATNRLLNLVQEVQEREQERRALHNALMMKKDNELAAVLHREQRKNDTLRAKIADLEDALAGMQRKLEDAERAVQTAYRPTVLVQPGSSLHLSGDDDEERLSAEDEVKRLRRRVQRLEEVCSLQKKRLEGDESYLMYVKTCQKRVADLQFVLRRTEEVKSELQRLKEDTVGRFALALPQMLADEIERLVPSLKVVVTAQTENAKKAAASRFAHAMAPKGKQAQQPTPPQPPAPQQQPTPDSAPSQVQEAAAPAAGPVLSAAQLDSLSDELGNLREALGIPPDRAAREEAQGTPSWVHTVWKGFSDDATFPIPPLTAADVGSADSLAAVMSGFISFAFSATTHATAAFDEAASQEQTPSAKPRRVSASRRRSSRNRRPSKATTAASGKEPLFTPPQPPSQRLLPPSVAEGGGDDLADAAMAALSVCSEDAMAECDADQLKEKVQQMAGFTAALSGQVQEERRVRDELLQELSDMRALVQRLQSEDPAGLRRLQADEVGSGPSRRGSTRRSVHKSPGAPPLKPIPSVSSIQQSSVAAASTSYRGKPSQASHRSASHASGGAALSSRSPQRRSDGSVSVPHYDGVSAHGSKHELDVPEDVVVMHEGSAGSPALVVTDHALAADSDGPGLGRADDGGGGGDAGGVVEEEDGADEQAGKPADRHKVYCYVCGSGPYRDREGTSGFLLRPPPRRAGELPAVRAPPVLRHRDRGGEAAGAPGGDSKAVGAVDSRSA
eukprot:TRINITY_DN8167_c0_g1_i1.p1 TRINITY_DN8167_c0_g1~~TRINITY_DN8167_c0_g1_i1.p1  ORF type:complete len:872 (+),score=367.66 TRINITY_DN8167_c0_g1_i1:46-2616(+)